MSETVTQVSETVQQIVRSRTCGCRDFYIAKITQNDATGYVAGTPVKLARAIKAKVDEKWTSEKIYSDDGTEEVINSYEGTEVARVISFEAFSMMVDEALEKMKKMLESNKAMQELVNGEAGEVGEKAV